MGGSSRAVVIATSPRRSNIDFCLAQATQRSPLAQAGGRGEFLATRMADAMSRGGVIQENLEETGRELATAYPLGQVVCVGLGALYTLLLGALIPLSTSVSKRGRFRWAARPRSQSSNRRREFVKPPITGRYDRARHRVGLSDIESPQHVGRSPLDSLIFPALSLSFYSHT